MGIRALSFLVAALVAGALSAQEALLDVDFGQGAGPFALERATAADMRVAEGMLALAGRADGAVRSLAAGFGVPLSPQGSITVRQRAEEGAYGGLYLYAGTKNVIQLGLGQGPDPDGLMFELDNHDRAIRQTLHPEAGSKRDWHEYRIEVDGTKVALSVDGRTVVRTTYSGLPPDRVAIWNGMRSRGEIQTERLTVLWSPARDVPPVLELAEDFDNPDSLGRWRPDGDLPEWQIVADRGAADGKALHGDFRRRGRWSLLCLTPLRLEARSAYRLRLRLRAVSGVAGVRLALRSAHAVPLARIDSRSTNGYADREATFVTGAAPCFGHLALEGIWGGGTVWIDSLALERADPPPSPYRTGVNLLHATLHEPGNRVGLLVEAEGTAAEDVDGDGLWAAIRLPMPERVVCDVAVNPWGFSDNTVLKSDLVPGGEPLRLSFGHVLPGRYRAYLSDPRRPAAVRIDEGDWTRVEGGREAHLGVLDIAPSTVVQVAHRFAHPDNPGPVYVDYVRLLPVHDEAAIQQAARRVHGARLAARETGRQRATATFSDVPLTVAETAGISRRGEPVTTGVPFAAGTLCGGARLRLADEDGRAVPCHAASLVHWPDGSVKWLRLRFRADIGARQRRVFRLSAAADGQEIVPLSPARGLPPEENLETGALRMVLGPGFVQEVQAGAARPAWQGRPMLRLAFGEDPAQTVPLRVAAYREVERTPFGRLVEFSGEALWEGPEVGVQGRLLVDGERPVLSLDFWLVNRSSGRMRELREATLCLPAAGAFADCVAGLGEESMARPLADGWALRQEGTGSTVAGFVGSAAAGRPGQVPEWRGGRLAGWLAATGGGGAAAVGVREFVERCPKGLAVVPRAGGVWFEIGLLPAGAKPFVWHQGVALAHQLGIAFPADAGDCRALLAATMHPLRATVPPEALCGSGAFGPLRPRGERPLFPEFEAETDRAFALIAAERSSYGIEDFGGVFQPGGYVPGTERMWTNMEYDFPHAALSVFARTGNTDLLERAEQATRHFVPVDIIHWSPDGRTTGGSHTHSHSMETGHQVEGPNFGHAGWPQGPLHVYYLTGERQGLDAGLLLAGYVLRHAGPRAEDDPSRPPYGLREERDAGNALLTCIATYEATDDPACLETAYRVLDWVERCQAPGRGNWPTPITEDPPHRGSTFMVHQLYQGLDAMQQVTGDPRIAAIFRRHAAWLLDEARDAQGRFAFKYSPRYQRGASARNFPWYALAFERAAASADEGTARRLLAMARESMEALFGSEALGRSVLFETDNGDPARRQSVRAFGGEPGAMHDYALAVRGTRVAFAVDGRTSWEGEFSGTRATSVRLWSGMRSIGTVPVRSFAVDRLAEGNEAETLLSFDFEKAEELAPWRALLPEGSGSRVEVTAGALRLVDADGGLIGAELDLPPNLGPAYRLRWRQAMPEEQYGGLMVFADGERGRSEILHVGLNQGGRNPGSHLFDNPRSFAPLVTYLGQLASALEE